MIFSTHPGPRLRRTLGVLAVLAALAGCGGGTEQQVAFFPDRVIAFGDESSALTDAGRKYSINGLPAITNADGSVTFGDFDCRLQPNWAQSVAAFYGFVVRQCNPGGATDLRALNFAAAGATVDDIKIQVDAQIANGGFQSKDLVTLMAGANDIVALYQQYPNRSVDDLKAEAGDRGRRLAAQVNRIVGLGPRVLIATVPDLGITPYANAQRNEFGDRANLLSDLTAAFNEQLGVNIELDGRVIGLVSADVRVQTMAKFPASFGLTNVTDAACLDTVTLVNCTNATLKQGASAGAWLWADDLHLSYAAHSQIATLALDRATRNPF